MTLTCWAKELAKQKLPTSAKQHLIIIAPATGMGRDQDFKFVSKPQAVATMQQQHHYTPAALWSVLRFLFVRLQSPYEILSSATSNLSLCSFSPKDDKGYSY